MLAFIVRCNNTLATCVADPNDACVIIVAAPGMADIAGANILLLNPTMWDGQHFDWRVSGFPS